MKKLIFALALAALLAGCSTGPAGGTPESPPSASPAATPSPTAAPTPAPTLPPTPSPSPTPEEATPSPEPSPTPKPTIPVVTKRAEPGPGLPVGDIVVADGEAVYYYDNLPAEGGKYRMALYRMDRGSGDASTLQVIARSEPFTMQQIFLDAEGGLYYVLHTSKITELYKHRKPSGRLICQTGGGAVDRVDGSYIYIGENWYSVGDYKQYRGKTSLYTPWRSGYYTVDMQKAGAGTSVQITDTVKNLNRTCTVGETMEDADKGRTLIYSAYDDGTLYAICIDNTTWENIVYTIDAASGEAIRKQIVENDFYISAGAYAGGTLYFAVEAVTDNGFASVVYAYDTGAHQVRELMSLPRTEDEHMEMGTCLTVCAGYLWAYLAGGEELYGCCEPVRVAEAGGT